MPCEHVLDLMFSQLQIWNTVECRFVVGLQISFASELKQVLKVKIKFVLELKFQVSFRMIPLKSNLILTYPVATHVKNVIEVQRDCKIQKNLAQNRHEAKSI